MNRVERTRTAVERICATTSTADDLLEALADEMRTAIPHDAATYFGVDPVTLLATAPSRVENLDAAYCDTYWHHEFHHQDTALFTDLARCNDSVSALQLATDGCPGRSIRYREFMRPQGYSDELRGVLRSGDTTWGLLGLYRCGGEPFDEDDLAVVRAISSLLGNALRAYVRDVNPWLGQPSAPGLVVVDGSGHVLSANEEAIAWLKELWPASVSVSEAPELDLFDLRDEDQMFPTALHALVSRATAVADGRERVPARLRLRDRRGRWVVLHASVMNGRGDAPATIALVIEAAKSAEVAPIIIDAYSLTGRERDVLGAIARGGSTAEIANELFLSQHTVRDYVKAIFEKFDVSSRSELVARLYGEHYVDRLHETLVHVG